MKREEFISRVREFALENSEKDDLHGFPHVERVLKMSINLGKELGANPWVLKISTLLHDIGRMKEKNDDKERNHAEISSEMALNFLNKASNELSPSELENIIHCIKAHSFSNTIVPNTLEAQILSDADKLDALGAIGLYRTIGFTIKRGGDVNKVIEHLEEKILRLGDLMFLETSKRMARERTEIIKRFHELIQEET